TLKFIPSPNSRSVENANLVVNILNASTVVHEWLLRIKKAWDAIHPDKPMEILGTQIQSVDWDKIIKGGVSQSGPPVIMPIKDIVHYYKKKEAHYIQIQGKGLYSFNNVLELKGATSFAAAAKSLNAFIKPEILKSGGNKVFRASISLSYANLPNSKLDLANPAHAKIFARALKSS
ncbi:MAG: hypothetical protein EBU33_02430, partial [Sphingobacteriia bacterium]|nr:hypothetical protein [Sphingobacteriia bacterium]